MINLANRLTEALTGKLSGTSNGDFMGVPGFLLGSLRWSKMSLMRNAKDMPSHIKCWQKIMISETLEDCNRMNLINGPLSTLNGTLCCPSISWNHWFSEALWQIFTINSGTPSDVNSASWSSFMFTRTLSSGWDFLVFTSAASNNSLDMKPFTLATREILAAGDLRNTRSIGRTPRLKTWWPHVTYSTTSRCIVNSTYVPSSSTRILHILGRSGI